MIGPWLDGIVLPKVESVEELATAEWLLAQCEREAGIPEGSVDLLPIIETAKGAQAALAIARSALLPMRHHMVSISRAAGLEPPLDTVFIHLREAEAFAASCAGVRALGFQGKLCIHPGQIEVANSAFTPSAGQVAYAEKIVEAFEAAEAEGSASIQVEGYFVDYPIVEKARRTLALVAAIEAGSQ